MPEENQSEDEVGGNSDKSDSKMTDETVANQRCTCVEGQARKCLFCRRQQQKFNSETYRTKLLTERAQYKEERDNERFERKKLEGQLSVYASRFSTAVEYASEQCRRCGVPLEHRGPLVAPDVPTAEIQEAHGTVQLADCEEFLRNLNQPGPNPMKGRRRETCKVCTDESCAVCVRKKKSRETAAQSRERKRNAFEQCQYLLQWTIEKITKQEGMIKELTRQNARMSRDFSRRCPECGVDVTCSESKLGMDAPPRKRAALDYPSATFGSSLSAGPSGLQQGAQEAVNAATTTASKNDDEDDDASMDGHHQMLRGRQREALWREVAATRIDLTVLGHGPPRDLVQSNCTERESDQVGNANPSEQSVRHGHSLGALQSVGITYTTPPSPPCGSHAEAFALRSAAAANVMLTDAEQMDNDENLEALSPGMIDFIDQLAEEIDPTAFSDPSSLASILGGPDQQPSLDVDQGPPTGYSAGGGVSRSDGPSHSSDSTNPANPPSGSGTGSGPSDDASATSRSQSDGSTTKEPGFVHSSFQTVQSFGKKTDPADFQRRAVQVTVACVEVRRTFATTKLVVHFNHFMPPDAPIVESGDEAGLFAEYELVDEIAVLTLTEDDYSQYGTAEQQENLAVSTAVNEVDHMPEAPNEASIGCSTAVRRRGAPGRPARCDCVEGQVNKASLRIADKDQDRMDANSDESGSEMSNETEAQRRRQMRHYVANQRCTCVKGQDHTCEGCRTQQRLNSEASLQRIAMYKKERDKAREANAELHAQLDAYRPLFTDALQHQSKRCQGCGTELPPVLFPSDAPSQDDIDEETANVIAEGESLLRQLKPPIRQLKPPKEPPQDASTMSQGRRGTPRKSCDVCGDARTCPECQKREMNRLYQRKQRKRKQKDGQQDTELLGRLIEVARKQGAKSAELSWQNAKLKEVACRRCPSCGGVSREESPGSKPVQGIDAPPHKHAAFDVYSATFGRTPPAIPSTSGLQRGGQEAVNISTVFREASKKDDEDDNASMDAQQESLSGFTVVNEEQQMPEASVDASRVSNAGAILEKVEETEVSTSWVDGSSDDDTEESGDEENP